MSGYTHRIKDSTLPLSVAGTLPAAFRTACRNRGCGRRIERNKGRHDVVPGVLAGLFAEVAIKRRHARRERVPVMLRGECHDPDRMEIQRPVRHPSRSGSVARYL